MQKVVIGVTKSMQTLKELAGRYLLQAELGRGGMGVVYQAQDLQENRLVAIKGLLMEQFSPQERQEMSARFGREARTSLKLEHANIVRVYDFIEVDGQSYLIMEYLEGQTFKDFIQGRVKLEGTGLLDCLIQICDGLNFAHQHGVIHRDIKPDNLFITHDGNAKIMDFGIARQNNAEHFLLTTQPGIMMGTLNYMSPEQLQDSAIVDQRTDIFSLGVVMYEVLTGKVPFDGESMGQTIMKILSQEPIPPSQHNTRLPAELEKIILKCLTKRRGQRYQSCGDVARDLLALRGFSTATPLTADPAEHQQDTGPNWRRQTLPQRYSASEAANQTRPAMGSLQDHLQAEALLTADEFPQKLQDRQAGLSLECSPDGLQAWISVDPTYALEPPSVERIQQLLSKAGIVSGLLPDVVSMAAQEGFLDKTLIASGQPPIAGRSAQLESLLEEQEQGPLLREDGSVDYRELRRHQSVQAGTPLLRKHPIVAGQPGLSIHGKVLQPEEAADCKLLEGPGTALASDDNCLLIATRAGMPVRMARSMRVEPVLSLDEVGVESGNVRFDGSVVVQGNVHKGFRIEAGGDIIVHGTVEDAVLIAGGNLYLYGSVFGGPQTLLQCRYHLQGLFIQQARIDCGGDLDVQEALMYCTTRVTGKARIGSGEGKGVVNGGELYSTYLITLHQGGSVSATQTQLAVGSHPRLEAQMSDLEAQQTVIRQQLQDNIKNMIYLRTQGGDPERMQKLEQARSELMFESNTLNDEVAFLQDSLKQASQPKNCLIRVQKQLHPGVRVNFSGTARSFDAEVEGPVTLLTRQISPRQREVSLSFG